MLLAFDDTDDLEGGCTTYMVFRVLLALPGLALRGMPRLVRLNPNIPQKTRGNAAVVLDLVVPEGAATRVGELKGHEIRAFPDGREPDQVDAEAAWSVIKQHARPGAEPGLVWGREPPSSLLYWQGVQDVLSSDAPEAADGNLGGRGRLGATAAMAWQGPAASYEFIAYRHPAHWGKQRDLDPGAFALLDGTGKTFHTWGDGLVAAPATPCPVLIGLRGLEPEALREAAIAALQRGAREPVDGWLLFATNQASGDHVRQVDATTDAQAHQTVAIKGTVDALPIDLQGGHVRVDVHDTRGHRFQAVAFEPTHGLRRIVRSLRPGDRLVCVGAWKDGAVHLEKLEVVEVAPAIARRSNPVCPECGTSMKSRGTGAGFRCKHGHGNAPEDAAAVEAEARSLRPGWYEVPVRARRHLHRPLFMGESSTLS